MRRVGKLYLGGTYFLCRHCYGLAYDCQRESPPFRRLHQFQKLCRRLGADPPTDIPPKPKRMRWRTYERLVARAEEADAGSWVAMLAYLERAEQRMNGKKGVGE
jgi:hypothetical protein